MSLLTAIVLMGLLVFWHLRRSARRIGKDSVGPITSSFDDLATSLEDIATSLRDRQDASELPPAFREPPAEPAPATIIQQTPANRPAIARRSAKYLLDGDDGHRSSVDRVAALERMMRGPGLCSRR